MTKRWRSWRLACLSLVWSTACQAEPPKSKPGVGGVYVVVGPRPPRDPETTAAAIVSPATGMYIRTLWSTIQPQADSFDWSRLDGQIAAARRVGKKISLGVRAGEGTPEWLLRQVPSSAFVVGHHRGASGVCATVRIPHPWAKGYQSAYGKMMGALAAHLRTTGAYGDVTIIKVTGMNTQTEEMHIPSFSPSKVVMPEGACALSEAPPIWQKAGYRPGAVIEAWKALATSVNAAFPDKVLSIPVIGANDFPPFNAMGQVVRRSDPTWVDVKSQIILAGTKMFPGRFAVQWNGLNDRRVPKVVPFARANGAIIGLQSNMRQGPRGGAGCNLTRRQKANPCSVDGYRAILSFAKRSGASFVEIWPVDAVRFGGVVAESAKVF